MTGFSLKDTFKVALPLIAAGMVSCNSSTGRQSQYNTSSHQVVQNVEAPKPKAVDSAKGYEITVELKESHFTMDLEQHLKDEMNAAEFNLPVSAAKFKQLREGQTILDEGRSGSFWISGSIGDNEIEVIDKPAAVSTKADKSSYDVTLELSQSHMSLDLTEHFKDSMNKMKFHWQVPGDVYNQMKVGQDMIDDGFRAGSFILKGSVGSWHLKVKSKNGPAKQ